LRTTEYYNELVNEKGLGLVEKRHKFMDIEYDNGY